MNTFTNKQIYYCEILEQVVNGVKFFQCQKEKNYVIKITSCYGVLNWMDNHEIKKYVTNMDDSYSPIRFKYSELISHHNQAKNWVDDTNNQSLDPIALSVIWRTNR